MFRICIFSYLAFLGRLSFLDKSYYEDDMTSYIYNGVAICKEFLELIMIN